MPTTHSPSGEVPKTRYLATVFNLSKDKTSRRQQPNDVMISVSKFYSVTGMEHHPSRPTRLLGRQEEQGIPISILPEKLPRSCQSLYLYNISIEKTNQKKPVQLYSIVCTLSATCCLSSCPKPRGRWGADSRIGSQVFMTSSPLLTTKFLFLCTLIPDCMMIIHPFACLPNVAEPQVSFPILAGFWAFFLVFL